MIPDNASLAHELHQEDGLHSKVFLESGEVVHNGPLPEDIQNRLNQEVNLFFQNN